MELSQDTPAPTQQEGDMYYGNLAASARSFAQDGQPAAAGGDMTAQEASVEQAASIKTMPARFYLEEAKVVHVPKVGFWVIIVAMVALVVVGGLGSVYYLTVRIQSAEQAQLLTDTQPRSAASLDAREDFVAPTATSTSLTDNQNTTPGLVTLPIADDDAANAISASATTSETTEIMPEASPAPVNGVDADADGLTDVEEKLYGANPAVADTDGDTYQDGAEVANHYNPNGQGTLEATALFSKFFGLPLTFFYPIAWQRTGSVATGEVKFAAPTGEFFQFLIAHAGGMPLGQWYQEQTGIPVNVQAQTRVAGHDAIRSVDGLTLYTATDGTISIISYNAGPEQALNYKATFAYIIDTLEDASE